MGNAEELLLRIAGDSSGGQAAVQQVADSLKGLGLHGDTVGDQLAHAFESPLDSVKTLGNSLTTEVLGPLGTLGAVVELFSKAGRDNIPFLMKDLDGLVQQSKALGLEWSEHDAKGAEEFEMQTRALQATLEQLRVELGKGLIPIFTEALTFARGS